jgi:hypothetical protein
MNHNPLALILFGHGLAALGGLGLWLVLGAGAGTALLAAWIGGAVLTLGLGALTRAAAPVPAARGADGEGALARDLAAWERDTAKDRAEGAPRRRA